MNTNMKLRCFAATILLAFGWGVSAWSQEIRPLPPTNVPPPADIELEAVLTPEAEEVVTTEESVEPWMEFVVPSLWDKSFELGMTGSEGNSETFNMQAGTNWKLETDHRKFSLDFKYFNGQSRSVQTQHNAVLNANHEWLFANSPWTLFTTGILEYDEFKAFDLRLVMNSGLGYRFINRETTKLTGRMGAGVSREFGGPDDSWTPEAVLGMEYEHKISKRQKFKIKMDYMPDWGDFASYRLWTDAGWELVIDEEANLSLKIGLVDRYDSTPNGRRPNDLDYSILLLWKPK